MSALLWVHPAAGLVLLGSGVLGRARQEERAFEHPTAGDIYFWLLIITGATGMWLGSRHPGISVFQVATPPTLALAIAGYLAGKFKPRRVLGAPWLRWHIIGMGGSYIGAVTAASFQIVPRLLPRTTPLAIALFAVPSVVGTWLIRRAVKRWLPQQAQETATLPE